MILNHIEIQNYRCFKSIKFDLKPDLNVFVGGNGSGKSSLLDAIRVLLAPILSRLPFEKRPTVPGLTPQDIRLTEEDRSEPYTFLQARGGIIEGSHVQEWAWDRIKHRDTAKGTKEQAPRGRRDTKGLYSYVDSLIEAHNQKELYQLPVFAHYGTNRAVDVPHNRMRSKEMPRTFRRLVGLENALESKSDFRRAVSWFDMLEQREFREKRDNDPPEAALSLTAVRRAIEQMIPRVQNPRIDSKTGRFAVDSVDTSGARIRLHLEQLSDGYQVMLGVVMDFALRLSLANPPCSESDDVLATPAILIIDEIDLHLHPSWQQRVIPDLRRTFPNTQLILTTHSPQVLSTVDVSTIGVLGPPDGTTQLSGRQFQTRGVESAVVLAEIMGVDPVPDVPQVHWLSDYRALIETGREETEEGKALKAQLIVHFGEQHPLILECERLIRFTQFKRSRLTGDSQRA